LLTDAACRQAKPGDTPRKLFDSGGLYLMVLTSGTKSWRWKYSFRGREKTLSLGLYPELSLRDARLARDAARQMLSTGVDPSAQKRDLKVNRTRLPTDSFEQLARAWHEARKESWSPRYAQQILDRLENHAFSRLGARRIGEITAPMVLDVIRKIEDQDKLNMARKVRMHISDVFVWAIASGLATTDPASMINRAMKRGSSTRRPAALTIEAARAVLVETEKRKHATITVLLASRLLALTAARPAMVCTAEKSEFIGLEGPEPLWHVPAAKMKLARDKQRDPTYDFLIPLSIQAAATVRAALAIAPQTSWLFAGIGDRRKPISDSTLSKLYRIAGFEGVHVPHGWRSSFSTIMNEQCALQDRIDDRKIIDLMLAHAQPGVEPIYNRAAYLPRRRQIAQAWADMLMQGLPPPESLIA
jgi:integrase